MILQLALVGKQELVQLLRAVEGRFGVATYNSSRVGIFSRFSLLPHPFYSRELIKQRVFCVTNGNRKWTFRIHGQWFCTNFQVNRLYKSKENLVIQMW